MPQILANAQVLDKVRQTSLEGLLKGYGMESWIPIVQAYIEDKNTLYDRMNTPISSFTSLKIEIGKIQLPQPVDPSLLELGVYNALYDRLKPFIKGKDSMELPIGKYDSIMLDYAMLAIGRALQHAGNDDKNRFKRFDSSLELRSKTKEEWKNARKKYHAYHRFLECPDTPSYEAVMVHRESMRSQLDPYVDRLIHIYTLLNEVKKDLKNHFYLPSAPNPLKEK